MKSINPLIYGTLCSIPVVIFVLLGLREFKDLLHTPSSGPLMFIGLLFVFLVVGLFVLEGLLDLHPTIRASSYAHKNKVRGFFGLSPLEEARGLPFVSSPMFKRLVPTVLLLIASIYILENNLVSGSSYIWVILLMQLVPMAWCFFADSKGDAKWRAESGIRQQENAIKLAHDRQLAAEHAVLAEENARYAPLGERTATPDEISEAARRVAEELRKGV